jgi:hypothetical protein
MARYLFQGSYSTEGARGLLREGVAGAVTRWLT